MLSTVSYRIYVFYLFYVIGPISLLSIFPLHPLNLSSPSSESSLFYWQHPFYPLYPIFVIFLIHPILSVTCGHAYAIKKQWDTEIPWDGAYGIWENSGLNFYSKTYCGWLRNPAAPNGWLKPSKKWDKSSINPWFGFRNYPQCGTYILLLECVFKASLCNDAFFHGTCSRLVQTQTWKYLSDKRAA